MIDRSFDIQIKKTHVSLMCYDCGCLMGAGRYQRFPIPPFKDNQSSGFFTCNGIASAVLDGRMFMETGRLP